ncbi:hypothetical protein KVH24_23310 [Streptomyces olivaceus]|uniref:hypothetical protein n=1 Tax=Streptomyces olivaceus TaxID=47716 RepID=UPI001CCF9EBA|nr:hypothetical protein [Streptomyces olivaceus]MBZ6175557.1 hypothetical protein [Streptomyces olivaceus]MBZ6181901.1 hypothetical protein [Streptomyces olivaceus]
MTREERRAYIRRVVDDAPALSSEDADHLRALLPLGARRTARPTTAAPLRRRPAAA